MRRLWAALMAALLLVGAAAAEEDAWICPSGHEAKHHFCSWCGAPREESAQATEAVSAPNILKLGQTLHLDGIGDITPLCCTYYEQLISSKWSHETKKNEQYILLELDILNTNREARGYLQGAEITVVYDGCYTYQGEVQQLQDSDSNICNNKEAELDPLYNSSYAFACKLPSAVINGSGSLTLTLTLDGVQLTYDVR